MCVTDCEPSVVLDLCVITRDSVRYYLAIGVSSAGARDVSRRDAGVVRPSECELQCVSAATKRVGSARVSRRRVDSVLQVGVCKPGPCAAAAMVPA